MATQAQMKALAKARKALAEKKKGQAPVPKTTTATRPSGIRRIAVYDWDPTDLVNLRFGGQGTFENE